MSASGPDGIVERRNPDIKLNLYMMIAANFQMAGNDSPTVDYLEGLKRLSYIIQFFQGMNSCNVGMFQAGGCFSLAAETF